MVSEWCAIQIHLLAYLLTYLLVVWQHPDMDGINIGDGEGSTSGRWS